MNQLLLHPLKVEKQKTKKTKRGSKLRSGMRSPCGPGILLLTTVPFAAITLWTCVSNARPTKHQPQVKNAPLLGEYATMLSISIAFLVGLKHDKFAPLITENGSFRNMADDCSTKKLLFDILY